MDNTTMKYDDVLPGLNSPAGTIAKTGHSFVAWVLNSDGSAIADNKIPDGDEANSFDVKATWSINQYTANMFETTSATSFRAHTANFGTPLDGTLNHQFTKAGYTFSHWVLSNGNRIDTMPDHSVNIYPVWTADGQTVNFYPGTDAVSGLTLDNGKISISLATDFDLTTILVSDTRLQFSRVGHQQRAGWYSAATDGTQVSTVPAGGTNIYAQWTDETYNVTFDPNGADNGTATETPVEFNTDLTSTSATYWGKIGAVTLTKEGYTFSGWVEESDGTGYTFNKYYRFWC